MQDFICGKLVVGGGFEPPKASPADLQSAPFDRSGTPPYKLERVKGIEPSQSAWKADVLPLNYTRIFSEVVIYIISVRIQTLFLKIFLLQKA